MSSRRKGRECAVQILYQIDLQQDPNISVCIEEFFKNFEGTEKVFAYANSLVRGVSQNLDKIDESIAKTSTKWRIDRMPPVDRNILRLAIYELFFVNGLDDKVVMNEAIEIAKRFGGTESAGFINGILDSVAKKKS